VAALPTLIVALLAMGSLLVSARSAQPGRRAGVTRTSRTTHRLDAVDPLGLDASDQQDAGHLAPAPGKPQRQPSVRTGRNTTRRSGRTMPAPRVAQPVHPLGDLRLAAAHPFSSRRLPPPTADLLRRTAGRAPPEPLPATF